MPIDNIGTYEVVDMLEICCDHSGEPEMFTVVPGNDEVMAARSIARHREEFGDDCNISFKKCEGLQGVKVYTTMKGEQ